MSPWNRGVLFRAPAGEVSARRRSGPHRVPSARGLICRTRLSVAASRDERPAGRRRLPAQPSARRGANPGRGRHFATRSQGPDRPAMLTTLLALLSAPRARASPRRRRRRAPREVRGGLEETRRRARPRSAPHGAALRTLDSDRVRAMVRRGGAAAAVGSPRGRPSPTSCGRPAERRCGPRPPSRALRRCSAEMVTRARPPTSPSSRSWKPLPVGFPYPAPAGEIRVVEYLRYRMARADMGMGRSNGAFFTLFRHISDRDIAMTAPVEMTMDRTGGARSTWASCTARPTWAPRRGRARHGRGHPADDRRDHRRPRARRGRGHGRGLAELEAWLAARPGWEAAGNPRLMGYNGPSVPRRRQFSEVQIPVRRVER